MNRTDIPIARPCTADWSTMTLADRGRFCGECRKVVRELAQMTEREARALLSSPPTEGLCVRYVHDATGEILFRRDVVPVARLARRAAAVALAVALPLATAACGSSALTGEPPHTTNEAVMMGAPPAMNPPPETTPDG
ncbi:MAG TPA: hypothetical protein VIF15_12545, partial [Polyangiaceae bacterium]